MRDDTAGRASRETESEGGGTPYRVRPAAPADRDAVVAFNRSMARETEAKTLDPEVVRSGVAAILEDPSRGRYFLAETPAGEVAGMAAVTYEWSDWRDGVVWWIQNVYVAPEHRRNGVYSRLHRHIREAARGEGVIGLRLYVERENRGAQESYRSLGMEEAPYVMFQDLWGVPEA